MRLTDKLLEVCNKPAESGKTYSMDKICRGLTRLTTAEYVTLLVVCISIVARNQCIPALPGAYVTTVCEQSLALWHAHRFHWD